MWFRPSYRLAVASPLPLDMGYLFLLGTNIIQLMIVQQQVVILEFAGRTWAHIPLLHHTDSKSVAPMLFGHDIVLALLNPISSHVWLSLVCPARGQKWIRKKEVTQRMGLRRNSHKVLVEPNSQLKSENSLMAAVTRWQKNFRPTLQKGKLRPGEVSWVRVGVSLISNSSALH